jgi:lipid A ethanolaminephosphotransferase
MVMWWSAGFASEFGLQADCMRQRAAQPAQHDHLFHTVLALLDVRTALYEPALDLTRGCRSAP